MHILISDILHVNPKKCKTVVKFPTSAHKKNWGRFLGMVIYLPRFQPWLASDTSTLSELLGEYTKWIWMNTHDQAFKGLKEGVNCSKILRPSRIKSKELQYLTCDASDMRLGSWIGQDTLAAIRPWCLHRRNFNSELLRYSSFQKELLPIIDNLHVLEAELRVDKFMIMPYYKALLTFIQRMPNN